MLGTLRKAEYAELMILFFIQAAGMAIWFVPLGLILDAHSLHSIKPLAFGASAIAAFISPLMFGAMADRHVPPARVLRWLATATAGALALITLALQFALNRWLVLALIQVFYFSYSPMFSISTALVFARLKDAKKEFGPIRALATVGWMSGALFVGLLGLDGSALIGYLGVTVWLLVAAFTFFLPQLEIPRSATNLSWHERLGLDALTLLRDRDTRVVFLTTTFMNFAIAAFYPLTPTHLRDRGFAHPSAWMGLAQVSEVAGMFTLAWLLSHWRLKWVFAAGLAIGVVRFGLCALNTQTALLLGIALHGACYVLVFITAQIFLEQNVHSAWRARAQALLTLMNSGVGNFVGYLGTGWWFDACTRTGKTNWPLFWSVISGIVVLVLIYFLTAYREKSKATAC